ncbi:MAG: nitroreductase family protein [Rikenellaceae bacterium]
MAIIVLHYLMAVALVVLSFKIATTSEVVAVEQVDTSEVVYDAIITRTSVRSYTSQQVEREKIEKLLRAGMAAPTAGNRQPWEFIVVKERAILDKFPEIIPGTHMAAKAQVAIVVVGTPVSLYVKDDVIQRVEVGKNSETQSFMNQVAQSGLFERWNGVALKDAATMSVDGVSGATYTSVAIVENVKRAAQYGASVEAVSSNPLSNIGLKDVLGLLVIFSGVILTFVKSRSKPLVTLQLVLNVVVLGFWCGSFLSLATFTTWVANGVNLSLSIVSFAMLCVVVIVPLLGKKGSYCHLHCPMGSAQELISRVPLD